MSKTVVSMDESKPTRAGSPSSSTSTSQVAPSPKSSSWIKKNLLLILTVLGVVLGVAVGAGLRAVQLSPEIIALINFPGEIMLNMLKMVVVPLVVVSLIANLALLEGKQMGKIGAIAMVYYLVTTIAAVILGIVLVLSIHPGKPGHVSTYTTLKMNRTNPSTMATLMDLGRNMFTENLLQSTTWQVRTKADGDGLEYTRGTNVLGLIVASIAIGVVLATFPKKEKKPLVEILGITDRLMMKLVMLIMWYTPIGIFFLVCGKMLGMTSFTGTLGLLGMYMVTVITGLLIHSIIVLPLIYFICTRKNPFRIARGMLQALVTAFATASSSATLPISMKCLEEKLGIDPRIVRFVLPIGSTINMDGTALYEAVATIFIGQIHEDTFNMTLGNVVIISLTATLASIGAAAIPSAGIITMFIVLSAVNLPTEDVAIILVVDWILDRCRTTVNVWGDAVGAGVVHNIMGKQLPPLESEDIASQGRGSETIEHDEEAK